MARVERAAADFDAEGIDELRAGQQRAGVNIRGDFVNCSCASSLRASSRKSQDQKRGIDRGPDRQSDPDADRAEPA